MEEKLTRKETVQILYNAAQKFFSIFSDTRTSITFKEVHLTPRLRVDVLNISYNEKVCIVELKTCKEDFKNDSKWKDYLNYCDRFFFMCPDGVISIKDLPKEVGLIYVKLNNKQDPYFKIIKSPKLLKPKYISNNWLKYIFKKLVFRKYAIFKDNAISLEEDIFFK